jgi:hypothetical protein
MIAAHKLVRWSLALCLFGSLAPLGAQDTGFTKEFKFRLGYAPSPKDHLRAPYTGFGFNVGYGIGVGRIALELGYQYKTGDDYFTAPDLSMIPEGQLPVNPAKAVEDKRNQLAGFSVRTTFSRSFAPAWRWQAGLQFGGGFKHQYVGDCQSLPWDVASGSQAWRDFYAGVPVQGGLNPTPFAGVSWQVDKDSSVEFNVVFLNYQAIEYHHYAGAAEGYVTGTPGRRTDSGSTFPLDTLDKTRRVVPHAEIAYVFHF